MAQLMVLYFRFQLFLTVLVMWRLTDEEQFGEASSDTVLLVGPEFYCH